MTQISNRRNLIRRSDTPGVVPTINSSTTYINTDWSESDIMIGEWFMNSSDSRLWVRDDNGLHELIYTGTTESFVSLNDTPNTYTSVGDILVINSANTGLEFASYPTSIDKIVNMTDFSPNEINTGYTGYSIVVDDAGTGFTYKNITPYTFLTLSDTPTGYTANYITKVNSAADALEFVDGSNLYVELTGNQEVDGKKNFLDTITFEDQIVVSDLIFSGLTNVNITEISTDSGFTSVNDNTLVTSQAIYNYVNTLVYGSGATDGIVLVSNTQTITGEKTFSAETNFADINITNVNISGDIYQDLTSYQYFGDETTDGSFRLYVNAQGHLEVDKLVSGSWEFRGSF